MPRADLAFLQAAADERRPLRRPDPTGWAGPGAAVAWFLRLLDTYALGVLGRAVDARTERWTEPTESQDHHIHRAHDGHGDLFPARHRPGRRRRHGPAAAESAPIPRSHRAEDELGLVEVGRRALVRRRAGSQRRRPRAELSWPVDPSDWNWHRQAAGSPGPESLGRAVARIHPAGIRPVGP